MASIIEAFCYILAVSSLSIEEGLLLLVVILLRVSEFRLTKPFFAEVMVEFFL